MLGIDLSADRCRGTNDIGNLVREIALVGRSLRQPAGPANDWAAGANSGHDRFSSLEMAGGLCCADGSTFTGLPQHVEIRVV